MIRIRSLRIQLVTLYAILMVSWMSIVGVFTFLYLRHSLSASRADTIQRRAQRLIHYVNDADAHLPGLTLQQHLYFFNEASTTPNDLVQIFDLHGKLLYPSGTPTPTVSWPGSDCVNACFGEMELHGHRMRTIKQVTELDGHSVLLCIAGSMDEHYEMIERIIGSYFIVAPLVLLACIAGALLLIARAMKAVDRITSDARTIGIQDLTRRLTVQETGDELQRLTETWNELLGRLESAVNRLRQFTGDLSHDLRTSTTVMLATAQVALRSQRTSDEYRAALLTIAHECEATSQMLDDLLSIAAADDHERRVSMLPVNLAEVLEDVCDQMRSNAQVKQQSLTYTAHQDAWVKGDLPALRRLVLILLDNAVKYTPVYGSILSAAFISGDRVCLEVRDTGTGIAPQDIPYIFDRFYRADVARQREGGRGMGLAIANWISDNHQAEISVDSAPGEGSTFRVNFPRYCAEDIARNLSPRFEADLAADTRQQDHECSHDLAL